MKIYAVGGQVRDRLLGREVHDRDYVVVGSSVDEMLSLGYKQVGSYFPVFLHPETGDEYALARTERRTGYGHKGFETYFDPTVSLTEDLARRDLTINAMAMDLETQEIIDPFGGQYDIEKKLLRHTTLAFMDDPLRILRVFRFQSQLGLGWKVHEDTIAMCYENKSRLLEISPERKWKEMEKALHSNFFSSYARAMAEMGELPELKNLIGVKQPEAHHPEGDAYVHTLLCLEVADLCKASELVKFSVLCHDFGKYTTFRDHGNLHGHEEEGIPLINQLCERIRVPNEYRDHAKYVAENHTKVHCISPRNGQRGLKPKTIMGIFERASFDASKITTLAEACWCDAKGRGGDKRYEPYPQGEVLLKAFSKVSAVCTKDISIPMVEEGKSGVLIGQAIRVARINAIREVLSGGYE